MTDDPDSDASTDRQFPPRPHGIAHGGPERAAVEFDGRVDFGESTVRRPQVGARGGDGEQNTEKYDDEHELRHNVGVADDQPCGAVVTEDMPRRQWKLHVGMDVAAPDESGEWQRTADGDATDESTKAVAQALCQQKSISKTAEERVVRLLADEDCSAWSTFGGVVAAVVGVLLALGYEDRGHELIAEELGDKVEWWADIKGIDHRRDAILSFGDRLRRFVDEREDIPLSGGV